MKKLIFLLPLFLLACSQNDVEVPENLNSSHQLSFSNNFKIEKESAIAIAEENMSAVFGERTQTRTSPEVTIVRSEKTRSNLNLPDTLYYIINYGEEDGGFAMVSADKRLPDIMAISDTGRLDLSDTTFNRGLANFMKMALSPEIDPILPPDTITSIRRIVGKPMLKPNVRTWTQTKPFNIYCPENPIPDGHYYTGCTPLAIAQIMSYYEWPKQYGDLTFNWSDIKNGKDYDNLARLLSYLGNQDNMKCNYEDNGTGSPMNFIHLGFTNFGYTFLDSRTLFDKSIPMELLLSHLSSAHPILIYGAGIINGSVAAHTWVGDGMMIIHETLEDGSTLSSQYIHCVWGWGGASNGYFLYKGDGIIGGKAYSQADDDQMWNKIPYYTVGYVFDNRLSYWDTFSPIK